MDQIEASIAFLNAPQVGDQAEKPGDSDQTKKTPEPSLADLQARLDALEADKKKLQDRFEEVDFSNKYHSKKVAELQEELQRKSAQPANGTEGNGKRSSKIDDLIREVAKEIGDPYEFIGSNEKEGKVGGEKLAGLIVSAAEKVAKNSVNTEAATKDEVRTIVNDVLNGFLETLKVSESFPELNDTKSEFSKRVAVETANLQKDAEFSRLSPAKLTHVAAMSVRNQMISEGHDFAAAEAERDTRIRRASGGGGSTKPSGGSKKELDQIGNYFAQKAGITPEEYLEEEAHLGMWPS
jgi:hypothetical protein